MSQIFGLKTDQSQLSSANRGMSDMHYVQYAPSRDVTGNNFPGGAQYIKWQVSGQKWWVPARSYLRLRAQITDNGGNQIDLADDIAPNMSLFANLFQSLEFRIESKTVCRISDYVPQIDMLCKRLDMSKSWLDSTGGTSNFYKSSFRDRQNILINNSTDNPDVHKLNDYILGNNVVGQGNPLTFLDLATPNQVQITAANLLIFTQNGGTAIPDLSLSFRIGEILNLNDGAEKVRRITGFQTTNTTNDTIVVDGAALTAVGAANLVAQIRSVKDQPKQSRSVDGFEIVWQPPLGIFKIDHAMPAGNYELVLNPQNTNVYQKLAIESIMGDKNAGVANDFIFSVVDMYLYVCQVEGPRIENLSYYLDLDEYQCQRRAVIAAAGLQQEEFSVSPSTHALAIAFQDNRSTDNTQFSASKYKIGGQRQDELKLIRLYVNYAGMNKPQPDADPKYKITSAEDYTIQRYIDSVIYSGCYYDPGGCESIQDWHDRGPYYYWSWPKDGTDRSTRVFTNYQFNQAINNGSILLFNMFKKAALIKIENGNATMVQVQEM